MTRRRLADGLLLSKWQYATNGAMTRCDDYDDVGRVLRTFVKWHDGSSVEFWFDQQHRLWRESRYDPPLTSVIVCDTRIFLLRGNVTLHPSQRWSGTTHKLNDSRDMVSFRVVGSNSTNAILSVMAHDLAQPTNRAAFVSLPATVKQAATETSEVAGWSIYILRAKRQETQAEVRECFLSSKERIGLHVRLTIPASMALTKDQRNSMEQEFKSFLETVEVGGAK